LTIGETLGKYRGVAMHAEPDTLIFLPGALGNTQFWAPVSDRLACQARRVHMGWPGFGGVPADPAVRGLGDLAARVVDEIDSPTALVAQSMGGVIAMLAALEKPEQVTHLVLAATSGGMDMSRCGAEDWRPSFIEANPSLPRWFSDSNEDLTPKLPSIRIPVLLLWGDADPISPVLVGRRLVSLLPRSTLHVFAGGDHDVGNTFADEIAPLIDQFLVL